MDDGLSSPRDRKIMSSQVDNQGHQIRLWRFISPPRYQSDRRSWLRQQRGWDFSYLQVESLLVGVNRDGSIQKLNRYPSPAWSGHCDGVGG